MAPRDANHGLISTLVITQPERIAPLWHSESAPKRVVEAYDRGERPSEGNGSARSRGYAAWRKHLKRRGVASSVRRMLKGDSCVWLWGIPADALEPGAGELIRRTWEVARGRTKHADEVVGQIEPWLTESAGAQANLGYALQCLAWCHALPSLSALVGERTWWSLWSHLVEIARQGVESELVAHPLDQQLLGGELGLALACQFPELKDCRRLARLARAALDDGLDELLDGDGLPQAAYLVQHRALLACWTRCRLMGEDLKGGSWKERTQSRFEWALRAALQLSRPDGTPMLDERQELWPADFLEAALAAAGDREDRQIARQLLERADRKTAVPASRTRRKLPSAVAHSEWAELAVMRSRWTPDSPYLAIDSSRGRTQIELGTSEQTVLLGEWAWRLVADGNPLGPAAGVSWEVNCWASDEDGDFLELELELDEGMRLQRCLFLARKDGFLLLADAVLSSRMCALEYSFRLPLTESIKFEPEAESREGYLVGKKRLARVLPMALPEWRVDPRVGRLEAGQGHLELVQRATGDALLAPLFIDLDRRRLKKTCTWRQLTVGEELQAVPPNRAVGYRVQVGCEQWLCYRSLTGAANRTVLGQNLMSELLIARFDGETGDADTLVEVE